ncbi:hypothetical protein MIV085L [Invertebrate iridescent virus 3]|uniref:Uncharacterized protein 085L n=1 Tax=Invertebrate iridescent virus 3 TaxID=345201 RepID=VF203_IIV3|nr:hypothetical protein MIV085L [Invertebrate iridescent virus 3]Q196X5.1 RecName: Full=Uncharacterized protein 085L [Invertebrate iridescent virus 3]ABF82115.1 hypothetical protein MIV085L [Invertebrate iridescent virus 3]
MHLTGPTLLSLLAALLVSLGLLLWYPTKTRTKDKLLKDLNTLKINTVNLLNQVLKTDTTKLVDFHIANVHCDGIIDRLLSPDELAQLYHKDYPLYKRLVGCGYTKTVGLLHGFALWASETKTRDVSSLKYFIDCISTLDWKEPNLFAGFHTTESKVKKCIV